jgi:hypothetical protein
MHVLRDGFESNMHNLLEWVLSVAMTRHSVAHQTDTIATGTFYLEWRCCFIIHQSHSKASPSLAQPTKPPLETAADSAFLFLANGRFASQW